ncbi:MAG TPA: hypothetical protein VEU09_02565 [Candidatus Binatia bacterium]|nr:hypothetical protein [Candidatus Binatia bacterium]
MTPAEDQAIRANLIAIFEWVVTPVCIIASIVQVWLLSRTGAFTRARQFVPAIVVSPMLMIALMFAFAWVLDRLPGGVLRGMYVSLRLLPPEVQFEYAIFAPGIAAAVVAYTIVGKVALMRATRRPIPDH